MALRVGSRGAEVSALQGNLNLVPGSRLAPLVPDGTFGNLTLQRVLEFQRTASLVPDGVVGNRTLAAIVDWLGRLVGPTPVPPTPPPAPASPVRLITNEMVGTYPATDNLITQILPAYEMIERNTFQPDRPGNVMQFRTAPATTCRLAIFACGKNNVERAVILCLPQSSRPTRVVICVSHGFGQNAKTTYDALGWSNPLSVALVKFCLLSHVVNRYAPQVMAARQDTALMVIIRAKGSPELGPFANDGAFLRDCLQGMAAITNNAFAFDAIETFTYSSGIHDFNTFNAAAARSLNVKGVYAIDPAKALPSATPQGAVRKQYLSGQTGGPHHGFFFLPLPRWKNEGTFIWRKFPKDQYTYLHGWCMPRFILYAALT